MALKAGYIGVKRRIYEKLQAIAAKNVLDIADLWSSYAKTGSVNYLPNILTDQTKNGISVTVDADKVVTLDTDGSATASATSFVIYEGKGSDLQWLNGKYLSGCIDGSDTSYIIRAGYNESPWTALVVNKTAPVLISGIPNTDANIAVSIYIYSGTILDNVKLYPMVADSPNAPYAPYAMTNQQLTKDKLSAVGELSNADDLNNVMTAGLYTATTSPAHTPEGRAYFSMLVSGSLSKGMKQLIMAGGNNMYLRSYGGSPASWGNWYKYTGTEIVPAAQNSAAPETRSDELDPVVEEEPVEVVKKTTSTKKTATNKEKG